MKKLPQVVAMTVVNSLLALTLIVPLAGHADELSPVKVSTYAPPSTLNLSSSNVRLTAPKTMDRWEKFQAEFGDTTDSNPPLLEPVARGKHTLDVALFTAIDLADRCSNLLELRYARGHFGRATKMKEIATPPTSRRTLLGLDDTRVKFDVALAEKHPYLGVRIVLPFGN